ncbi:MAG: DUF512 domain-containing protein [Defluviitaleaceae bacterium]|nr:DUF512 domain-containing protein [Defluviitaleaceae bacterium]
MKHEILKVAPNSIAQELGILPGDFLLRINGTKITDVLDYQFATQEEELVLEIEKPGNPPEIWELEIEKDAEEDLGLGFLQPLMSPALRCCNKCIFCFVDQQPQGLRPSLYVKDDDPRLSFLHGNYVTLTNLTEKEIRRIAGYHLSPLRISVHAADLELRKKMMGCKNAGKLFDALAIFADAGIKMHFQAVLCKGINDGKHLDYTIKTLAALKGAESLAIVPAGITRHRQDLAPLEPFGAPEALAVISQIENFQKKCLKSTGRAFVFAADEWYIIAGFGMTNRINEPIERTKCLPDYHQYENFPQLDNGVGMLRLFEHEFNVASETKTGVAKLKTAMLKTGGTAELKTAMLKIGIVTGYAAAEFMREIAATFEAQNHGAEITVYPIENNFFGKNITVSGLLTGQDIIEQLKNRVLLTPRQSFALQNFATPLGDVLFLPENAFRIATEFDEPGVIMLDGTTRAQLSDALGVRIEIGSADGEAFYAQLLGVLEEQVATNE